MGSVETVSARGLVFRYGGRRAVRGVGPLDLTIGSCEVVGVLGPNGAGKSTLLRVLATILQPGAGTLRLLGDNAVPAPPALRRRLGWASDEPVHFDALTGWENARFFARAAGAVDASVSQWLEAFRLADDAHRPVRQYSLGMRRKLLLAEAFAAGPPLLLLDEPTLGLDPPSRAALLDHVRHHAHGGGTVVLATNDVDAAAAACTRVVFLNEGTVVLEGNPAELLARLSGYTTFSLQIHAEHPPTLTDSVFEIVSATEELLEVRSAHGTRTLPSLIELLVQQSVRIREIHVREPDLRDVFSAATGLHWRPDSNKTVP
jgi:ABC-2 type transport system ATP-binding protein